MSAPHIAALPAAQFLTAPVQVKPWGREVLFASGDGGYVGKLIAVDAGHALSLQFHRHKDETISIVEGRARFEHGPSAEQLETRLMEVGDTVHVPPLLLHRLTAITDVRFVEASTAAEGWRDDVVRVSDRYGRTGTSSP